MVGLHRDDIKDHENFDDYENGLLDSSPPYYDGGEDAIYGIIVVESGTYSASEINGDIDFEISNAKESFKNITGLDGKVFITPVIW